MKLAQKTPTSLSLSKACSSGPERQKAGLRQAQPSRKLGSAVALAVFTLFTPAAARENLGIYESWGAFRDARPPRCFAIAEPARAVARNAPWRPFASIAVWPTLRQRTQLHIRLRRPRPAGARVALTIGGTRFALVSGGADAWAQDPRMDAAIVAAMRSAQSMTVSTPGARDTYRLRGAATAIDAASLGCARRPS